MASVYVYIVYLFLILRHALMSEVLKVLRYIASVKYCTMNKGSNAMYVNGVKRSSKWSCTSLLITFLILTNFQSD